MSQNQEKSEITVEDQINKFLMEGFYGFNTILTFGFGKRLGIFDYLYEKSKTLSDSTPVSKVLFTPEELSDNLDLSPIHLDAWVHMALECGFFEIENASTRSLKTAPHVFNLLIDRNHMLYIGGPMGFFYYMAPFQDALINNFKTGENDSSSIPEEFFEDAQRGGARGGELIERLFANIYKDFCDAIRRDGIILAVGCGYGYNLEVWARKYKKARFVGIDIDPRGISGAKKMIEKNNWGDRIEIYECPIDKFARKTDSIFNLIILKQVLHEMDHNEEYRRKVFKNLYSLLKDDGILLVCETMVHDTFAQQKESQIFEVMHKFFEAGLARFYDEKSFREFVDSTPFKKAKLIKERNTSFWVVEK